MVPANCATLLPGREKVNYTGYGGVIIKKELMDILACPLCKGDLQLTVEKEDQEEIITGSLYCQQCDQRYPIEDSIPNLLPPELRE